MASLARLEAPLEFSPRIESFALVPATGEQVPLFGVDLIGDTRGSVAPAPCAGPISRESIGESSAWVSASLGIAPGETLEIVLGDRRLTLDVQGVLDASFAAGSFVVMDIAPAQRALGRIGWLDRIYVYAQEDGYDDWRGAVTRATGAPCSRRSCRPRHPSCRPGRGRRTAAGCSARSAGTCG